MSSVKKHGSVLTPRSGDRRGDDRRKVDRRNYAAAASHTDEAILDYLESLNSAKSLAVWLLYKYEEYEQLVNVDINPLDYEDYAVFRDDYAAQQFLSKAEFIPLDVSKDVAAFAKFFKFEQQCKVTNERFRRPESDPLYQGENVYLLNATIRKISQILGDFSGQEWVEECNWGPGSSTLLKGAHVSAANKYDADNGVTADLYSFVCDIYPVAYPLWWEHLTARAEDPFLKQSGNRIVTVPKNSKTNRVIAIEPAINLYSQKGIGTMIRKRLLRWGVNLNDQSINQRLSRLGSVRIGRHALATIDFSSASDSISLEVVRSLFSGPWLQMLELTRSPLGTHDGSIIKWEKFSSMGNGFTFELESLIFFAAALSVKELVGSEAEVSVYGDDVILPVDCVEIFRKFCSFLGFSVNEDKSFSSSKFRESCGAHYFSGHDVKPIYLKKRLSNIQSIYKLANSIRLLAHRRNLDYGCDARFRRCFANFLRRVPKRLQLKIPAGLGEGGFVSNFDEACPSRERFGIEGYRVLAMVDVAVKQRFEQNGMRLANLDRLSRRREVVIPPLWIIPACTSRRQAIDSLDHLPCDEVWTEGEYSLRDVTRSRLSVLHVRQWYDLGPWR